MRKLGTSINEAKWGMTPDELLAVIRQPQQAFVIQAATACGCPGRRAT